MKNDAGLTPLMKAVDRGDTSSASLLLMAGASLEVKYHCGRTIFQEASKDPDMVELLEKHQERRQCCK